jgi:twitching motility two-component system response regulator PilG
MKKDTYSVEVIGFNQTELMALTSVFDLSSRRVPKFARHNAFEIPPDILLVDANDIAAVRLLGERNASGLIPTIMVGDSNRGTGWPLLARPIRWMKLFQAFDVAIGSRASETPAPALAPGTARPLGAAKNPDMQPDAGPEEAALQIPAAKAQMSAGEISGVWRAQNPRIESVLVVDDNLTVREFMKNKLAPFNFNVDYAENGEQAIGFTGQKHYTCIFLDVVMPGIDGYQVCKLIKSNRSAQKSAVVMLTSKDSPFDKIRGSMSGCDAYLTKPVDEEKLLATIARFLRLN